MKVVVKDFLNVRVGKPSVNAPCYQYIAPGSEIEVDGVLYDGDFYDHNNRWMKDAAGNYYWSGGIQSLPVSPSISLEEFKESDFWWLADFNIEKLWNEGLSGRGIRIAVLDSGLSLPHPDLVLESGNQKDLSESGSITDQTGHGTHVTGIIKASNNGLGIKGIAFNSEFYFAKITNDNIGDSVEYLISGMEWAIEKNVDIISISNGLASGDPSLKKSIEKAAGKNILIVCAAGNKTESTGNDILYPAKYTHVLSIGGLTRTKDPLPDTINAHQTNLFAPGENILSTHLNKSYKPLSGSSQATPFVAGVAALLLEAKRKLDKSCKGIMLKERLLISADKKSLVRIVNPLEALKLIST